MGMTQASRRTPPHRGPKREGFLYVAVLFTTLILVTVVATAMQITTQRTQSSVAPAMRQAVQRAAESEIHRLAVLMRNNVDWRTTHSNNVFSEWRSSENQSIFGEIQVRHRYVDSDGDLTDSNGDSVELHVHAKNADTEIAISVKLVSDPEPYEFLSNSVTATNDLEVKDDGMLTCDQPVVINDDCLKVNSGTVTAPKILVGANVTATIRGELGTVTAFTEIDLVQAYASVAEPINTHNITNKVISSTHNPFGSVSPIGVYKIDAKDQTVRISNSRIEATIVILDARKVQISKGIVWECPAGADAIIVSKQTLEFNDLDPTLDENESSENFNPTSTPYREDQSDSDQDDVYPQTLRGLIYSLKEVRFQQTNDHPVHINGGIYGKNVRVEGRVRVSSMEDLPANPSLRLRKPIAMQFARGSWRQIETP